MLGEQKGETAWLEMAVVAYRSALKERRRSLVPLDWAITQDGLGTALARLGEREAGTARLEEAIAAYGAALSEETKEAVPLLWSASSGAQGVAMMLIADRKHDGKLAERAEKQIKAAYEAERGADEQMAAYFHAQLLKAETIRDRLKGG